MAESKKKISFRIDPEANSKISEISRRKKISEGEAIRRLLETGFDYFSYEKMTGKFESLQENMETFMEKTGDDYEELKYEIGQLYKKAEATNMNVLRMNFLLDEFSKVMLGDLSKYLEMKKSFKENFLEFKNEIKKRDSQ